MKNLFDVDEARRSFDPPEDPGFVYLLKDRGRFKLGRTTSPQYRLRVARTWIPDIEIVAMKPFWFHRAVEWNTQIGLAVFHHKGEWFDFAGDEFEETFIDEFAYFSDDNPIRNSLSFPYFMNGIGMNEFTLEWSRRGVSKRRFLQENSAC
jgi:hypothetical protein